MSIRPPYSKSWLLAHRLSTLRELTPIVTQPVEFGTLVAPQLTTPASVLGPTTHSGQAAESIGAELEAEVRPQCPAIVADSAVFNAQVTASFRTAVRHRLGDSDNMSALASRGATGTAAYVRVHWGAQHADWKSMDTMDGTEITFAALLHDVARYWGTPADECALCHGDGAVWPLEAYVASEMRSVATPEAWPPPPARPSTRTHAKPRRTLPTALLPPTCPFTPACPSLGARRAPRALHSCTSAPH